MADKKSKVYVILPYLRTFHGVKIGKFQFKAVLELVKESKATNSDIMRVISFFRQSESRSLESFNYIVIKGTKEEIHSKLAALKRDLEIFRFLSFDPERPGIGYENTYAYLIVPDELPPKEIKGEIYYYYKIYENFKPDYRYTTFPRGSQHPPFVHSITAREPSSTDEKLSKRLFKNITDTDLRAISWYNKTYSQYNIDLKENLLRISIAFETFLDIDESKGREKAIEEIIPCVQGKLEELANVVVDDSILKKIFNSLKNSFVTKITREASDKIFELTGSENIRQWFKDRFYHAGSGIRHGALILETPQPTSTIQKNSYSLWYGGNASHQHLNNFYFGRRLFKVLIEEKYLPYHPWIKGLNIEFLEKLLTADEERLKEVEVLIKDRGIGKIKKEDIRVLSQLSGAYPGERLRMFSILQRLLKELKFTHRKLWGAIKDDGQLIIDANLKEEDFINYEKFNPYAKALIGLQGQLDDQDRFNTPNENDWKKYYIIEYIGYLLYRFI